MEECYERIPSDVRDVIKHAKLHESDLTNITQTLKISDNNLSNENLRLLQLDSHLLEELTIGAPVVFKGARNENAVLCTSTHTYDIKEAETSNSMLLVPGLKWGKETLLNSDEYDENLKLNLSDNSLNDSNHSDKIISSPRKISHKNILKIFYTYYEPRLCKPKLRKLNEVLQCTLYSGPEREYAIDRQLLFSFTSLKNIIQCSDTELIEGLRDIKAIEMNGFYRMLSFEYEFRVLSQMLDLIEENSWPLNQIDKTETITTLNNLFPSEILDSIFHYYASKSNNIDDVQYYEYDETKVCRIFAQYILKDTGKFNLNDFIEVWKSSVPEGMNAQIDMLKGIALHNPNLNPPVIWSFLEEKLPENIMDRFKVLFLTKEKWTVEEISPYIENYTTDKIDVNALLTKYARASNQNNTRYYSAKHCK